MKTWFIADTHFRHNNILSFENRPFDNQEIMEEEMIKSWNKVVAKDDVVYHIGDFCFGGEEVWIEILNQLNGKFILIKGNHDKDKIVNRLVRDGHINEYHKVGELLKVDKMFFNLTHYPLEIGERPRMFNISGHIHSRPSKLINQLNVGVDSELMKTYYETENLPFGTPVSFDYLMSLATHINDKMSEKYTVGG